MSAKKQSVNLGSISAAKTQSYRAAYEQLARIAGQLEDGETDLDKVLPLLAEAQAAYEVCRGRVEALRTALDDDSSGLNQLGEADNSDEAESDETETDDEDDDFF
ncbi:exodeoxyribonuclease VII small subunit [Deinococcus sp.]|uniref:exodeoxyribonuclease VII small subunit n=1 Tax=Deinococcus sp. TaxID=47478 RepID=UPI003B5BC60A